MLRDAFLSSKSQFHPAPFLGGVYPGRGVIKTKHQTYRSVALACMQALRSFDGTSEHGTAEHASELLRAPTKSKVRSREGLSADRSTWTASAATPSRSLVGATSFELARAPLQRRRAEDGAHASSGRRRGSKMNAGCRLGANWRALVLAIGGSSSKTGFVTH